MVCQVTGILVQELNILVSCADLIDGVIGWLGSFPWYLGFYKQIIRLWLLLIENWLSSLFDLHRVRIAELAKMSDIQRFIFVLYWSQSRAKYSRANHHGNSTAFDRKSYSIMNLNKKIQHVLIESVKTTSMRNESTEVLCKI